MFALWGLRTRREIPLIFVEDICGEDICVNGIAPRPAAVYFASWCRFQRRATRYSISVGDVVVLCLCLSVSLSSSLSRIPFVSRVIRANPNQ